MFVASQRLMTLVGEQKKSLEKLKHNLLKIARACRVIFEQADDENNYIEGGLL